MTHQVTGAVAALTVRNLVSKAGKPFTKHGVKLTDGREFELDGFKQRYAVGQVLTDVGVSLKYKVWTETGGYAAGAPAMPRPLPAPSAGPAAGAASYAAGGGRDVGFPIPQGSYQTSIIRQNALTSAVNLVNTAFGSVAGDLTGVDRAIGHRADLAMKVAYKFAAFSSGQLDTLAAEEMAREIKGMVAKGIHAEEAA